MQRWRGKKPKIRSSVLVIALEYVASSEEYCFWTREEQAG